MDLRDININEVYQGVFVSRLLFDRHPSSGCTDTLTDVLPHIIHRRGLGSPLGVQAVQTATSSDDHEHGDKQHQHHVTER